jgi:hypothetical protein
MSEFMKVLIHTYTMRPGFCQTEDIALIYGGIYLYYTPIEK